VDGAQQEGVNFGRGEKIGHEHHSRRGYDLTIL